MKDLTLDLPACPAGDVTDSGFASCCRCETLIRQSYSQSVCSLRLLFCSIQDQSTREAEITHTANEHTAL